MRNERNAGRKPRIPDEEIQKIYDRYQNGESISALTEEYKVSKQALYKRFKSLEEQPIQIEWMVDGECVTSIDFFLDRQQVRIANYASKISKLPFGFNDSPSWQDFVQLVEETYLEQIGANEPGIWVATDGEVGFSLKQLEKAVFKTEVDIPTFRFTKKDILLTRTDTDGFQMKALSQDRRHFIKSQAIMAGVPMRDWTVEIIASDIAHQLEIPCVEQKHCLFVYGEKRLDGVFSDNFELDGDTFVSFESLLESVNQSSHEEAFIKLSALEKLKWCATKLSELGELSYSDTERYMINLAVLDCLVGNIDRHTRNFGLFYNHESGRYRIPLIFDNGMGLFENDYYRDNYSSFDAAMNQVYVAPYGEDPFGFLQMLNQEFHLKEIYSNARAINYLDVLDTPNAREYERRMAERWQK